MSLQKRALSLLLTVVMVLGMLPLSAMATGNNLPFTDVSAADWFYDGVKYAYDNGLVVGTTDTTFEPSTTTTRAMVVTILYRLEGSPAAAASGSFTDVAAGSWYTDAIEWASANDIVDGYGGGLFGPNDTINREQMATIFYRYSKYKGYDLSNQNSLSAFSDFSSVSDWAKTALAWANAEGLITGTSSTTLSPKGAATRAEVAVILQRFCENIVAKDEKPTPTSTPTSTPESTFTVTFDLNYGTAGTYQTVSVNSGDTVSQPANPTRSGNTFTGWYTVTVGGQKFDFDTAITKNITLYAHWSSNNAGSSGNTGSSVNTGSSGNTGNTENTGNTSSKTYSVTFYMNDGTAETYTTSSVTKGGKVFEPDTPTRSGYAFIGWYTDVDMTTAYDFDKTVSGNLNLYAGWKETAAMSYTVTFNSQGGSEVESQTVNGGGVATQPFDPVKDDEQFIGWYESGADSFSFMFDFSQPITSDITLYAKWFNSNDDNDSDSDGLPDSLEIAVGSNPYKNDSDDDGVSDYNELNWLNYNPMSDDTDGNGVLDKDEDPDGDGLTNGEEEQLGTNPAYYDTDYDGLSDYDEKYVYRTDPLKEDTDGDGVLDGIEISIEYDPLSPETSFVTEGSSGELSDATPVVAAAEVTTTSGGAGTLEITPASYEDSVFISESIPGYLGDAYKFSTDGDIESAVITFTYDESLGQISDEFQPRIYYLNEEDGTLEELENQIVSNGTVSAVVEHFSIYLLLNKADFDEVWNTDILVPTQTDTFSGIDVVFAIDSSGSMTSNDSGNIRHFAVEQFIDKLSEDDRGAVVDFDYYATVLQPFTSDHDLLYAAVEKVDASGNTNLSNGMSTAISLLTGDGRTDAYKCIIFLTDGDGTYDTSYTELAANSGIIVYTVGLGKGVKADKLQSIADGTGGMYYFASTADNLPEIIITIRDDTIDYVTDSNNDGISDYYTSLINSGDLLLPNGTAFLVGATDMYGEDSDDWDGDGLKNGEEITIKVVNGVPYISMTSNPLLKDSDLDGYSDALEIMGMDTPPLKITKNQGTLLKFMMEDEPTYQSFAEDPGFDQAVAFVFDWHKTEEAKKLLIDYFYDYASAETIEANSDAIEALSKRENVVEVISTVSDIIKTGKSLLDMGTTLACDTDTVKKNVDNINDSKKSLLDGLNEGKDDDLLDLVKNGLSVAKSGASSIDNILNDEWIKTVGSVASLVKSSQKLAVAISKVNDTGKVFTFKLGAFTKFSNKYQTIMGKNIGSTDINVGSTISIVADVVEGTTDVADVFNTYGKMKANAEAFVAYVEVLDYMTEYGGADYVRIASSDVEKVVLDKSGDEYFKQLAGQVGKEVGSTVLKIALDIGGDVCPYVKVASLVWSVVKASLSILGITDFGKTMVKAKVMTGITEGCIDELESYISFSDGKMFFSYSSDDADTVTKYMTQLAQSLIYGENAMKEHVTDSNLTIWIARITGGTSKSEMEEIYNSLLTSYYDYAQKLGLTISTKLLEDVSLIFSGNGGGGGGSW